MVPFSFAGRSFAAFCSSSHDWPALYWPERRALLVADMHLEKASWYAAKAGQMLPPYDSNVALDRIEALVAETGAEELWCLGDSFHDAEGVARLPIDVRARIEALSARLRWKWIVGNHDPALSDAMGGEVLGDVQVDGLWLRHAARRGESAPELSGHFHPQIRMTLRGRHIARRCFVAGATRMILPAFGTLAGGMRPDHPEIVKIVGADAQAMVPLRQTMLRFPLAGSAPRRSQAKAPRRPRNNPGIAPTVADMLHPDGNA